MQCYALILTNISPAVQSRFCFFWLKYFLLGPISLYISGINFEWFESCSSEKRPDNKKVTFRSKIYFTCSAKLLQLIFSLKNENQTLEKFKGRLYYFLEFMQTQSTFAKTQYKSSHYIITPNFNAFQDLKTHQ